MSRPRIGSHLTLAPVALAVSAEPAFAAGEGFPGGLSAGGLVGLLCLVVVGFWVFSRLRWYKSRGPDDTTKKRAADAWKYLASDPSAGETPADAAARPQTPAGNFDQADFLDGARVLYSRLQTAWAARRLEELRPFVAEALFARFEEEARRDPAPKDVAVVLVEGTFAGFRQEGETERAEVLFKALLREGGAAPAEVRERWTFTRGPQSGGMWRLEALDGAEAA